jgi:tetratricopeptide (TPR) repeat protein
VTMSGNRETYQSQMELGNEAAWQGDWASAVEAYTQAVQEFADEADAHINLGYALLQDGQFNSALKVYKKAVQLAPNDAAPLEGSADALERMGRLKEAAQQYVKVSDVYLKQRDIGKAIANWEHATQLTPGLVSVHAKLAQAYERIGDKAQSIREYLILAFNFQKNGDIPKAIKAAQRALRLDKRNSHTLNILRALESGGEVQLPEEIQMRAEARSAPQDISIGDDFSSSDGREEIEESDPLGPLGEAMSDAMEFLAQFVVEGGLDMSVAFALQAMESQRQGLLTEAAASYMQAVEAGMSHPALKLNLGGLLVLTDKPKDAVGHLGEATLDPNLSAGALHGMGLAYYAMDDQKKASRYLTQSLRTVDTMLATSETEIEQLTSLYENLLAALSERDSDALKPVNERLSSLLSGSEWKRRISETRRHLEETFRDEGGQGLLEILSVKGGDAIADTVSMIDRYIRQGLYVLAMDEAHLAVENSPYYLPVHVRMAEVMMKEGRIRQAIDKYNMVAKAYIVRNENQRAASILSEVLEMAPLDAQVRMNLIRLLEDEERWDEALDQYMGLANTYQQLSDFDKAGQTYSNAEKLARQVNSDSSKIVSIKHRIADIAQMRLNTRQAQRVYEEIIEIDKTDEKSLRALVDIYFTQGNAVEAVRKLDRLLGYLAQKGQINSMTTMLEDLVRMYPSDTALRSRMAQIYQRLERKGEAIEQLDALGELQLELGSHKDAANTIRKIIALKPDRVEDYQRLLSQLGG